MGMQIKIRRIAGKEILSYFLQPSCTYHFSRDEQEFMVDTDDLALILGTGLMEIAIAEEEEAAVEEIPDIAIVEP